MINILLRSCVILAILLFTYHSFEEPFTKFIRYIILMAAAVGVIAYIKANYRAK